MKTSFFNILTVTFLSIFAINFSYAQTVPNFGVADRFALYTSVGEFANTGTTTVTGDIGTGVGVQTGDAITVTGQTHFADVTGVAAATDVAAAYALLASPTINPCDFSLSSTITDGTVLLPGIHCSTAATSLTGNLTLNGDVDAIFIIKINGAFSVNAPAAIILTGGVLAKNVYWQVGGALNLAAGVSFIGSVVNDGAISLASGATLSGRALSVAGKISLNNNIVSNAEVSLPVTLVSFEVKNGENASAMLTWATTSETNSDRFEIQRSQNGKTWIKIASVLSSGDSKQLLSYSFVDLTPRPGNNLYRLKMIDKDETFGFSRIRSINSQLDNRTALYPNPAIDRLTVLTSDLDQIERVQFMDVAGKLILDQKRAGSSHVISEFNINNFPAGLYIVKVTFADGSVDGTKIVKK
ncbi:ice-binding family protein [Dyadobacter psychrophilus]|uniref:Por secretion system C-terminal sorting domain-containing protein n=1 Tax=Dyadobacter psychrophilus TaxID=651661 RepID=A0A1T5DZK9_9BACT|nr:ice-binding family protein [Dyadobacter psychrophilus]SKB77228.1 Por secretion system C-terminal sorting domain-containing protein [Dyadobacter psychrophilus]